MPNRDRHDQLINERAVPILNAEAVEAQSAQVDLVSGATLTSQGYTAVAPVGDRPGQRVSRRAWVEQVMGMPVSIHLRGPDVRGPRRSGRSPPHTPSWPGSTPSSRPTAPSRRSAGAGEVTWRPGRTTRCSPRSRGSARSPRSGPGARSPPGCRTTTAWSATTRPGWSRAGPSTAPPGTSPACPRPSWSVNAGGDVLVGRHHHVPPEGADAAPWRIGVEDPRDRPGMVAVVPLTTGAVATSGTAARGAHLYDPATRAGGRPRRVDDRRRRHPAVGRRLGDRPVRRWRASARSVRPQRSRRSDVRGLKLLDAARSGSVVGRSHTNPRHT